MLFGFAIGMLVFEILSSFWIKLGITRQLKAILVFEILASFFGQNVYLLEKLIFQMKTPRFKIILMSK